MQILPQTTRTAPETAATKQKRPLRHSITFIVVIAFLLRLAVILVGHTYRINPLRDHFAFGWEMGRIARSIVRGQGFSSPTDLNSGPTAWAAPVYPLVIAAAFKIFGIYTRGAAVAMLVFNSIFASLTCWTLFRIGTRVYGAWVGLASAWTWAVFPYAIYWPVRIIWEVSFSTFLLSLALWLTIRMADHARRRDWAVYGLLWGLILLTNTTLVILLPFLLAWLVFQAPRAKPQLLNIALSLTVTFACVVPWTIRNYEDFHRLIFVRDNLALELHESNNEASSGLWTRREHPGNDAVSMRRFQELGEIEFMDAQKAEFGQFLREHPGEFLRFTAKRVWYFWAAPPQTVILGGFDLWVARHVEYLLAAAFAFAGLALTFWRKNPYAWLLLPFLLVYPIPYYLVNPFQRYKHPIETVMLLLILYTLWEASAIEIGGGFRLMRKKAVTS